MATTYTTGAVGNVIHHVSSHLCRPIITDGASQVIITGGLVVFGLIFLTSLVVGRMWCGYLCPAGDLQEMIYTRVNDRTVRIGKLNGLSTSPSSVSSVVLFIMLIYPAGLRVSTFFTGPGMVFPLQLPVLLVCSTTGRYYRSVCTICGKTECVPLLVSNCGNNLPRPEDPQPYPLTGLAP